MTLPFLLMKRSCSPLVGDYNNVWWFPDGNLSCNDCETTIFAGTDTTTLIVTGVNEAGCSVMDSCHYKYSSRTFI